MNALDALIVVAGLGAAFLGYRYGFLARVLSWVGLLAGTVAGVLLVDDIANLLSGATPRTRLIAAFAFIVLTAALGEMAGMLIGSMVRRRVVRRHVWATPDRIAGALAGVAVVLSGVWLLIPAFASAPGWPARAVRGSVIVRAVDRWAPAPPNSVAALGRLVSDEPFPQVFERLTSPDGGKVPTHGLDPAVSARVSPSVVKVEGRACDEIQSGSGFVAADELVVTNAHVVAGERATTVITTDGRRLPAVVVSFDGNRDVAVLRVRGLALAPLTRAEGDVGASGAVIGYPGGGPQRESPARIAQAIVAEGTNISRDAPTSRQVFILAAALMPGDSGGPLFDARGRVVGLAFAVDPSNATTAYALTRAEVDRDLVPVLQRNPTVAVDTGPCLVG